MPPDLNLLPTSSRPPSMSSSPLSQHTRRISISAADSSRPSPPSPRSPSLSSLQAAATINASVNRSPRPSLSLERRRSSLMNNLTNINDPAMPGPGELQTSHTAGAAAGSPRLGRRSIALADSRHHRQPSLGELHQELENEQEAQVNRLLHMIRLQQDQLAAIQRQGQTTQEASPTSSEHTSFANGQSTVATPTSTAITEQSSPRSATLPHGHFNRPHSLSRQSSARLSAQGNSRGNSPALRPQSGSLGPLTEDFLLGGTRDESAFYQAETQMLTRENQMLKLRIRELERQISDLGGGPSPSAQSPLTSPPTTLATDAAALAPATEVKAE